MLHQSDENTTFQFIKDLIDAFNEKRDWKRYHTAQNLSVSICLEASELLELFQWGNFNSESAFTQERLKEELADVLIYCFCMGNLLNLDLSNIIYKKIQKNELKYPCD